MSLGRTVHCIPRRFALLIVDMVVDIIDPETFGGEDGASSDYGQFSALLNSAVVPNVLSLAQLLRSRGEPIAWVRPLPILHRQSTSNTFVNELQPAPSDYVVTRLTQSAFWTGALDAILRNRGVTDVLVAGVYTNEAVLVHAVDASNRGYRAAMVADASAARTVREHDVALAAVHLQHSVVTTDEIVASLGLNGKRHDSHG